MAFLGTFNTRKPTATGELTKGLASGLGEYVNKLATDKTKEIERTRIAHGLQDIGFDESEAKGLSQLPEGIQREVIKDTYTNQRANTKNSEKLRHEITMGERGAKEQEAELRELERLEATGKIDSPIKARLYKQFGFEHKLSPETQAFQKVAQGFLRNAKSVFGARITDYDLRQYQQLFPTLSQSPEGRKLIIENIRRTNKAAKIRGEAMREIIREHKNRIPNDFENLIEQRVGAELDRLAPSSTFGIGGGQGGSDELPDPAANQGKKLRDNQTGQILQSDGQQWVPVGG
jgi:hypothetical protein